MAEIQALKDLLSAHCGKREAQKKVTEELTKDRDDTVKKLKSTLQKEKTSETMKQFAAHTINALKAGVEVFNSAASQGIEFTEEAQLPEMP